MTEKDCAQAWLVSQAAEQWDWVGGTTGTQRQCFTVRQRGEQRLNETSSIGVEA